MQPSSQNISHKKCLFIRDRIGNPVQSLVGLGYADVLCLTAVDPAAQSPSAIGILAVVDKALAAEKAMAAEGFDIDSHPVSGLYFCNSRPGFFYDSHHFMTDGNSRNGAGNRAVFDVKITGTDAGQSNSDNRIRRGQKNGFFFFFQFSRRPK